ncbi:hypothetical protein [Streptomyces sp. NPDC058412]|uniref:hypothetical protein n=1 Tax=Streptomyces sp. NPDC058412 TaxID=3346486 RepID=UPI00365A648A
MSNFRTGSVNPGENPSPRVFGLLSVRAGSPGLARTVGHSRRAKSPSSSVLDFICPRATIASARDLPV